MTLTQFGILKDLVNQSDALDALTHLLEEKKFPARSLLISEKEKATDMFFLTEGRLTILKTTSAGEIVRLGRMEASDHPFFGEAAILGIESRSASVEADSTCRCLVFSKSQFDIFAKKYPDAALCMYRRIAEGVYRRLEKANKDLLYLGSCGKSL